MSPESERCAARICGPVSQLGLTTRHHRVIRTPAPWAGAFFGPLCGPARALEHPSSRIWILAHTVPSAVKSTPGSPIGGSGFPLPGRRRIQSIDFLVLDRFNGLNCAGGAYDGSPDPNSPTTCSPRVDSRLLASSLYVPEVRPCESLKAQEGSILVLRLPGQLDRALRRRRLQSVETRFRGVNEGREFCAGPGLGGGLSPGGSDAL